MKEGRVLRFFLSLRPKRTLIYIVVLFFLLLSPFASGFRSSSLAHAQGGFVTRAGTQLVLNGSPFRFAGANIYWLGIDEGGQTYPTSFRINDAMTVANEMGLTVVRAHTLGISTGCALCVEPSLGNFNQTALDHFDYSIKAAQDHGLHLIIPLTDNYHYYHGGKHNFTDWRGISDENQFYTNPTVISDFEQYIGVLLNHVNIYTGVAYKDDPTIMAWETGNELSPPANWTQQIAAYIKSIDSTHLVMDGRYGIDPASLPDPNVDIYSDHFYPPSISQMQQDANEVESANKAYIAGEYDWETTSGDALPNFLSAIAATPEVSGDLFWDLYSHNDNYGYRGLGYGLNMQYPGDTYDRRMRIQELRTHGYAMQGQGVPADSVPGAPLITNVQGNQIYWRGTPVGDTYSVERSTNGPYGPWTVVCNRCTTDYGAPWTDSTQPNVETWYRMQAYNRVGVVGPYSQVYGMNVNPRLVDNLTDWSNTYSHSGDLHFDSSNAGEFNGDHSRVFRWGNNVDQVTWKFPGMTTFTATAYYWPGEAFVPLSFYIGDTNMSWSPISPKVTRVASGPNTWNKYTFTMSKLWNVTYLRVQWNNVSGQSWSPQLSQLIID